MAYDATDPFWDDLTRRADAGRARHGSELQRLFHTPPPPRPRERLTPAAVAWSAACVIVFLPHAARLAREAAAVRVVRWLDRLHLGEDG
ncbi:hypothetical protein [Occultella kanbiaonis]|uniref:hypothetical protein n=1 Tax=Occultella kanbiaonis TaxID=2675754 RepID=UPI0013D07321|nr:hypothetical protein [Occultella kanbiaonis]